MKGQNQGLAFRTDSPWPIEAMEEKMGILREPNDHSAVAKLAYELWEQSGRLQGASDANWFKALASINSM